AAAAGEAAARAFALLAAAGRLEADAAVALLAEVDVGTAVREQREERPTRERADERSAPHPWYHLTVERPSDRKKVELASRSAHEERWISTMRVHFIAVAGTGMGALAGLFKAAGHEVSGSDVAFYPPMGPALERWGVTLREGFDPAH